MHRAEASGKTSFSFVLQICTLYNPSHSLCFPKGYNLWYMEKEKKNLYIINIHRSFFVCSWGLWTFRRSSWGCEHRLTHWTFWNEYKKEKGLIDVCASVLVCVCVYAATKLKWVLYIRHLHLVQNRKLPHATGFSPYITVRVIESEGRLLARKEELQHFAFNRLCWRLC